LLHRFAARHHHTRCGLIAQIVARSQQFGLARFDGRLFRDFRGPHAFEIDVLIAPAVLIPAGGRGRRRIRR